MADPHYVLAAWFSPAYPVGAFAYSHGLEWAIGNGDIDDEISLRSWVTDCLTHGAGRNDAILLAAAYRDPDDAEIAELAAALQPSKERKLESMAQGGAFAETTSAAWNIALEPAAYPVAVGRAAQALDLPLELTIQAYLQAFAANLVSVGVRLIPIGSTAGQALVAGFHGDCQALAQEAMAATLDNLGSAALMADIAAMRHETQAVRLYRS